MSDKESPKGIKQFIVPVLVVVAVGLAFFSGTLWQKVRNLEKGTSADKTTDTAAVKVDLNTIKGLFDKDVIKFGDAKSKLIFVEMSDPSCPYCQVAGGHNAPLGKVMTSSNIDFTYVSDGGTYIPPGIEMQKLVEEGKASFVYIYFPGHGNGEMAMKALYCANEQGKFWEAKKLLMSDAGYAIQNGTDSSGKKAAVVVGNDKTKSGDMAAFLKDVIDPGFMKSCLDSGKYDARLQSDEELATQMQLQGTPNFYVNDVNFPGAVSYSAMEADVDAALK